MKLLPINKHHRELKAKFIEADGWHIPGNYTDIENEIINVRENIGITDLSYRGKLFLFGKDHLKFLQGMLSNDVLRLKDLTGVYATMLSPKGKLVSDIRVFKFNDYLYFDLEPQLNIKVKEYLTKYKLSYKANIDDVTNEFFLYHVCGKNVNKFMKSLFDINLSELGEFDITARKVDGKDLKIIKTNRTGEIGYDILSSSNYSADIWKLLTYQKLKYTPEPFGFESLNSLRIEAGIPIYNVDMDETTIPIEAGLWNALDFEKGCYIGQEVIARIKYRGRVNWHLRGFILEGSKIAKRGDKLIKNSKTIGHITSSTFSYTLNKPIAMGYIRREHTKEGTQVNIKTEGNNLISCLVADLPFYSKFK